MGFRAPIASLYEQTRWAYPILKELGFHFAYNVDEVHWGDVDKSVSVLVRWADGAGNNADMPAGSIRRGGRRGLGGKGADQLRVGPSGSQDWAGGLGARSASAPRNLGGVDQP